MSVDVASGARTEHAAGRGLKLSAQFLGPDRVGYLAKSEPNGGACLQRRQAGERRRHRQPVVVARRAARRLPAGADRDHRQAPRPDGSDSRTLTKGPGNAGFPSFSPDGTQVVYRFWSDTAGGLRIHDLADGAVRTLTTGLRQLSGLVAPGRSHCLQPAGRRLGAARPHGQPVGGGGRRPGCRLGRPGDPGIKEETRSRR